MIWTVVIVAVAAWSLRGNLFWELLTGSAFFGVLLSTWAIDISGVLFSLFALGCCSWHWARVG